MYNQTLFLNRRKFIEKLFYYELYDFISNIVNNKFKKKINILDFGCGDGAHTINILNLLDCKYNYYGFDYSKVAIEMASKYNYYSRFYFVGDVNDVPIKDKSVDLILDVLSPYNKYEVIRLLKDNGLLIKVSPGKDYLKELRGCLAISTYEKQNDIENN